MDNLKFSALLCSRLCHDLANPLGAISNGVEMLEMETDPNMLDQIKELIAQSAQQATNRLQYYRLAFGAAGGFGSQIGFDHAKAAIEAFFGDLKITVDFDSDQRTGSPDVVKLLMNLALSVGESIIRGGKLSITVDDNGEAQRFVFRAAADKIIVRDNIPDALAGQLDVEALDPKSIPAALAAEIADRLGAKIEIVDNAEGRFSLAVDVPGGASG